MATIPISRFESVGDSASLTKIDGQKFTITAAERSDYSQGDESTKGVKITVKESFTIDGNTFNKFHSTRTAVVNKLLDEQIQAELSKGNEIGPVKCVKQKNYFLLVDA